MRGHVCHRGPVQPGCDIVPTQPAPGRVVGGVVAVASEVGHIDPPDERAAAIHDHRLLVVAVQRMLAGVKRTADLGLVHQAVDSLTDLGPRGMKQR